ncbi:hypothetical protein PFY01_05310 [Brevundimonas vesicularis]|uniref:hypothetical protein n=1 Tax=Brevundimonas vesicularis TaxID=41276 RepID=UPI0022EC5F01|nr:hypothetical protein [Brevundimonas vesicularis]WBT07110.1 hypothetical protein PFY01_05310 [Brevundimonas vesicularis]
MAQVVLSAVGQQVGGGMGRVIGSTIGRAIDNRVVGSLGPARQIGARLETLKVQGTAEGSPMACVFGRARVTGQVIWAARLWCFWTTGWRAQRSGGASEDCRWSVARDRLARRRAVRGSARLCSWRGACMIGRGRRLV